MSGVNALYVCKCTHTVLHCKQHVVHTLATLLHLHSVGDPPSLVPMHRLPVRCGTAARQQLVLKFLRSSPHRTPNSRRTMVGIAGYCGVGNSVYNAIMCSIASCCTSSSSTVSVVHSSHLRARIMRTVRISRATRRAVRRSAADQVAQQN